MIQQHQADPVAYADLRPNTYVFNTVINCWAKSKEQDAASKAEEILVAMGRLYSSGMVNLKPDAFTYTAVIDVSFQIVHDQNCTMLNTNMYKSSGLGEKWVQRSSRTS